MYLAFYGNGYGGFSNKFIRYWTSPLTYKLNGKWRATFSHVEIVFSDGMMFSASQYEGHVRLKPHSFTGKAWVRKPLSISAKHEGIIRKNCEVLVDIGVGYDYLGVLGFVLPFVKQEKSKAFCSEVCLDMISAYVPKLSHLDSGRSSPNDIGFALGLLS